MEEIIRPFYPFHIGFDWHRTTVNIDPAIQRIAKRKFNVNIPDGHTRGRYAIGRYLSRSQFETILDIVITKADYIIRYIQEMPYALETMSLLKADGHFVEVITASSHEAHIAILQMLIYRQFYIATRSLGRYETKGTVAKDYDIVFEDNVEQAEECLLHGTKYVYLLDTPTNHSQNTSEEIIHVPDFRVFYQDVKELHIRLFPQCYPINTQT